MPQRDLRQSGPRPPHHPTTTPFPAASAAPPGSAAKTTAERFLGLGEGARLWLVEAAAAGTTKMRVKMAAAVQTSAGCSPREEREVPAGGRFLPPPPAGFPRGNTGPAGRSLTQGTNGARYGTSREATQ